MAKNLSTPLLNPASLLHKLQAMFVASWTSGCLLGKRRSESDPSFKPWFAMYLGTENYMYPKDSTSHGGKWGPSPWLHKGFSLQFPQKKFTGMLTTKSHLNKPRFHHDWPCIQSLMHHRPGCFQLARPGLAGLALRLRREAAASVLGSSGQLEKFHGNTMGEWWFYDQNADFRGISWDYTLQF